MLRHWVLVSFRVSAHMNVILLINRWNLKKKKDTPPPRRFISQGRDDVVACYMATPSVSSRPQHRRYFRTVIDAPHSFLSSASSTPFPKPRPLDEAALLLLLLFPHRVPTLRVEELV